MQTRVERFAEPNINAAQAHLETMELHPVESFEGGTELSTVVVEAAVTLQGIVSKGDATMLEASGLAEILDLNVNRHDAAVMLTKPQTVRVSLSVRYTLDLESIEDTVLHEVTWLYDDVLARQAHDPRVTPMVTVGLPNHPQALFAGISEVNPAFAAMTQMVGAWTPWRNREDLERLRLEEWDIVVAASSNIAVGPPLPGHMHVLAFGCDSLGTGWLPTGTRQIRTGNRTPSPVMHTNEALESPLRRLVETDLLPWLQQLPERPSLIGQHHGVDPSQGGGFLPNFGGEPLTDQMSVQARALGLPAGRPIPVASRSDGGPQPIPFICDAEGRIIAGAFQRGHEGGWCWALPFVPDHPELWLAAALADWHIRTPERVPAAAGWRGRPSWMTGAELELAARVRALDVERGQVLQDLDRRERELAAQSLREGQLTDEGPRQLLTATGESLVQAVSTALETFGFSVADVDQTTTPGTAKLEDLRVRDPDRPAWTCLVEVKGHTRGAKTEDLLKIGRFVTEYAMKNQQRPDSVWYIVNQFRNDDPDGRSQPLTGTPDAVAVFAETGGLVIDTREMFQLIKRVEAGALTPAQVRALMRERTGIFVA